MITCVSLAISVGILLCIIWNSHAVVDRVEYGVSVKVVVARIPKPIRIEIVLPWIPRMVAVVDDIGNPIEIAVVVSDTLGIIIAVAD